MAPPAAAGTQFTVWIHYAAKGGDVERARARDLRSKVNDILKKDFAAPGIQAVDAVPSRDQIRIYHRTDTDQEKARELQTALGLQQAQIVSLASVYPSLPNGIIEVWLANPKTPQ